MQLICRYGIDSGNPAAGIVIGWKDDGDPVDMSAHEGCVLVRVDVAFHEFDAKLGRFGPEPQKRGADPTAIDPKTGRVFEDRRPIPHDDRPWAAPDRDLALLQRDQTAALSDACRATLLGGFVSSALGAPHTYPSDEIDQRNVVIRAGAAILGQTTPGWVATLKCKDASGIKSRPAHTPAQLHQVLGDMQSFHDATMAKLDVLIAKVAAAATPADVSAVVWS